jgi:hypothetical protein
VQVERVRRNVIRLTLHAYEAAALVAAARWIVDGADGELTPVALEQLRQVLASYDEGLRQADRRAISGADTQAATR